MKNMIYGTMVIIVFLLSLLCVFAVFGRTTRQSELETATTNSLDLVMQMIGEDPLYAPSSNEELIADFEQAFFTQINAAPESITFNYIAVDYEKGLIRVEVIEKYMHLNGVRAKVSVEKTVIQDIYEEEKANETYTVTFKVNGDTFRTYTLNYGDTMVVPPEYPNKTITRWKDVATETSYSKTDLVTMTVESNMTFEAE